MDKDIYLDIKKEPLADVKYIIREKPTLTERQHDVASLALQGLSRRAIAAELFVSLPTVDGHLSCIYNTLKVKNFTGMVATLKSNPDLLRKSSSIKYQIKSPLSEAHRLKKQRLLAAQSLADTLTIAKQLVCELEETLKALQP